MRRRQSQANLSTLCVLVYGQHPLCTCMIECSDTWTFDLSAVTRGPLTLVALNGDVGHISVASER